MIQYRSVFAATLIAVAASGIALRADRAGEAPVKTDVATVSVNGPTAAVHTLAVAAEGDLQAALDAAQPGDVITLEPGATYIGNFVLPHKGAANASITLRSAAPDSALPPPGVRMTPAYAALLPKIKLKRNKKYGRGPS